MKFKQHLKKSLNTAKIGGQQYKKCPPLVFKITPTSFLKHNHAGCGGHKSSVACVFLLCLNDVGAAKVQLFSELQKQNNKWQNSSTKNSTLSL